MRLARFRAYDTLRSMPPPPATVRPLGCFKIWRRVSEGHASARTKWGHAGGTHRTRQSRIL